MGKRTIILLLGLSIVVLGVFVLLSPEKRGHQSTTTTTVMEQPRLSNVLNVYNWENYLGETAIRDFEGEFNVTVNYITYEDEDLMLSAVQSNPGAYDLIVASDVMVMNLIHAKLVAPLSYDSIPNFKYIDERFKNPPYDPGNMYSVPYLWGTTGIAINTKYVEEDVDSWAILWNTTYKGKIAMLNNKGEVIGAALKYLGYPLVSKEPAQLEDAREKLLEQKPLIIGYLEPEEILRGLISEDIWIAHIYSGDALSASEKNKDVKYIIPKEGGTKFVDNLLIPKDAKHKYTAEVFINYLLRPEVNAEIVNYHWFATANKEAEKYINKEILESESVYPSKEKLAKYEYYSYPGSIESIYNRIWTELQSDE